MENEIKFGDFTYKQANNFKNNCIQNFFVKKKFFDDDFFKKIRNKLKVNVRHIENNIPNYKENKFYNLGYIVGILDTLNDLEKHQEAYSSFKNNLENFNEEDKKLLIEILTFLLNEKEKSTTFYNLTEKYRNLDNIALYNYIGILLKLNMIYMNNFIIKLTDTGITSIILYKYLKSNIKN